MYISLFIYRRLGTMTAKYLETTCLMYLVYTKKTVDMYQGDLMK